MFVYKFYLKSFPGTGNPGSNNFSHIRRNENATLFSTSTMESTGAGYLRSYNIHAFRGSDKDVLSVLLTWFYACHHVDNNVLID